MFKYIEDKDVFQKFYSKMLAKRLVRISVNLACVALFKSIVYCNETSLHTSVSQVQHMSASDDAEASMISKLKQVRWWAVG